jgi:hypothetical protein
MTDCRACARARQATVRGCPTRRRLSAKVRCAEDFGFEGLGKLHAKWVAQRGRGFYTNIPLCHAPTRNWVVSLERLDQDDPRYSDENTVLEVYEANTQVQWSRGFADAVMGAVGV